MWKRLFFGHNPWNEREGQISATRVAYAFIPGSRFSPNRPQHVRENVFSSISWNELLKLKVSFVRILKKLVQVNFIREFVKRQLKNQYLSNYSDQSELQLLQLAQSAGKSHVQGGIGFSFASHWLKSWRGIIFYNNRSILVRSLANFYCQWADRHMKFILCNIDATSKSRKFEKSRCHFLTNRKRPFFLLANKRAKRIMNLVASDWINLEVSRAFS